MIVATALPGSPEVLWVASDTVKRNKRWAKLPTFTMDELTSLTRQPRDLAMLEAIVQMKTQAPGTKVVKGHHQV